MSTHSLTLLEERLGREAPGLIWKCAPATEASVAHGGSLPEQIQVCATRGGVPVRNSPFYLSGECLKRWGVDASATLICNELTHAVASPPRRRGLDWDRLAEF